MSISISINLLGVSPLPLSLPSHTYFLAGASNQMSVLLIYAFYEWERWRGRWPNKKFIHWSFYSQLHLFNVDKDEHAFALSLSLTPTICFSVWRNHSYFIKLTDYGLASLGFYTVSFWPEPELAVSLPSLARRLHCYANCSQWLRLMVKCVKLHSKS